MRYRSKGSEALCCGEFVCAELGGTAGFGDVCGVIGLLAASGRRLFAAVRVGAAEGRGAMLSEGWGSPRGTEFLLDGAVWSGVAPAGGTTDFGARGCCLFSRAMIGLLGTFGGAPRGTPGLGNGGKPRPATAELAGSRKPPGAAGLPDPGANRTGRRLLRAGWPEADAALGLDDTLCKDLGNAAAEVEPIGG